MYKSSSTSSSAPSLKKPKLSVEVDDISLNPQLIQKLKEGKLCSLKAILHLSQSELQRIAKVSSTEAKTILETISQSLLTNKISSAFDVLREENLSRYKFLPDILQNGSGHFSGIYTGTITEICGESGCGKTQMCIHLSIQAQKPSKMGGLESQVIYIHSEGEFPIKRFLQMANAFKMENPKFRNVNLSDNLILKKVFNLVEMMHILQKGIPDLLRKSNNRRIIIIDSVAAPLRCEYESLHSRSLMIQQFASEIWKLSHVYGMAVICVNQVSGSNKTNHTTGATTSDVPSLGLLWSNVLTTRMKISRKPLETTGPATRVLEMIYSSYHPPRTIDFTINKSGIKVIQ